MRQILFIQLSRVGDLVHTTPLLQDLMASDPGVAIDCLTFDLLAPLLEGLGLRQVHTIPQQEQPRLHEEVQALCLEGRKPAEIARQLDALRLPFYDEIISCDYGLPGAWLAGHIPARQRTGVLIDERGQCSFNSPWCSFRYGLSRRMSAMRINVIDLWRGMGPGATGLPDRDSRPWAAMAEALPFSLPQGRLVALNPGAQQDWRCWPVEHFALLAENLTSAGFVPVLVGAPADRGRSETVRRMATTPIFDCTGQTSLTEMVLLLAGVELLITNDTGAAHLAAASGTPVLGLYGNVANYSETVPWSAGNLILTRPGSSIFRPGRPIELDAVCQATRVMLSMERRDRLAPVLERHGVHAWETVFLPHDADPLGGIACVPLHARGLNGEELLSLALRHAIAWTLRGENGPFSASFLLELLHSSKVSVAPDLVARAVTLMRRAVMLVQRLEPVAQRARELAGQPDPGATQARGLMGHLLPLFDAEEPSDAIAELLIFLRKNLDMALLMDGAAAIRRYPAILTQTTTIIARAMHLMVAVLEDVAKRANAGAGV